MSSIHENDREESTVPSEEGSASRLTGGPSESNNTNKDALRNNQLPPRPSSRGGAPAANLSFHERRAGTRSTTSSLPPSSGVPAKFRDNSKAGSVNGSKAPQKQPGKRNPSTAGTSNIPDLQFGDLNKNAVVQICNTEAAGLAQSVSKIESRLNNDMLSRDEAEALKLQIRRNQAIQRRLRRPS